MLEDCRSARERWGGVSEIIDRWLKERYDLLTLFSQLEKIEVFDSNDPEQGVKLQLFCELMVDYLSTGHFEVFAQLEREGEEFEDREGLVQGRDILALIDETTERALEFNDKYQETDDLDSLAGDLGDLQQTLCPRFEAENQMISVLHLSHQNQVA